MPSAWQGIELFPKWKELNPPSPGRARPHDFPHDSDSLGRQFCKNPHVLRISAEHPQIFRTYSRTTSRTTRRRPPPGRLGSRKPGAFPFYGSSKIFNFIAAAPFSAVQNVQFLRHFVSFYIINTIRHIMTYTHPGAAPRLTSHVSARTDT